MSSRLIVIVGPTASGKSELALGLAQECAGEIISCDSLQVYRRLDIGSAKPTARERIAVPHHLIDIVNVDQSFSAAEYGRHASHALRSVASRRHMPLVVGGTGLYLRALLEGLFDGPARDPLLRARLNALATRFGDDRLYRLLRYLDPEYSCRITPGDRLRAVRALEVYWRTGRPISQLHRKPTQTLEGYETLILGLDPGRERLRERVERRTDQMLANGLLEEVEGLLAAGFSADLRPLQSIGYRQAVAVVQGRLSVDEARGQIVVATMRYAKRQMTWFRHQLKAQWVSSRAEGHDRAREWLVADRDRLSKSLTMRDKTL